MTHPHAAPHRAPAEPPRTSRRRDPLVLALPSSRGLPGGSHRDALSALAALLPTLDDLEPVPTARDLARRTGTATGPHTDLHTTDDARVAPAPTCSEAASGVAASGKVPPDAPRPASPEPSDQE